MKLTLEHLAPYLPYGLKGVYEGHGEPARNCELTHLYYKHQNNWEIGIELNDGNKDEDVLYYFKPILRPLSDLTKPITVEGYNDGEEFVPKKLFNKDYIGESMGFNVATWSFRVVELLFQWHFDVFGLIEKGLAVDINKIKKV